jgi:putative Mg2+ transporter-C (MgtC) family protein
MDTFTAFMSIDSTTVLRLALAIILGGAIGLEREIHGRPAGLRTHMLVCAGATVIMLAAQHYAQHNAAASPHVRITIDPGRIVAGIMTGIGFLGGGAIIRIGDMIRGLTTAACIWFVAALGIIIGEGFYSLALLSTASMLALLVGFHWFERRLHPVVYHLIKVTASLDKADDVELGCIGIFKQNRLRIQYRTHSLSNETGRCEITFHMRMRDNVQSGEIVRALGRIPTVLDVQWS